MDVTEVVDLESSTSGTSFKKASGTEHGPINGEKGSSGPQNAFKRFSSMTKEELIDNAIMDEEINAASRKELQRVSKMETLLHKENEKLTTKLAESRQQSDAERKRAEDAYEKLEKISLFNKVAEEGMSQKFFNEKKYEKSIEEIKTECNNRLRQLEEELRNRDYEIKILTNKIEQSEKEMEKTSSDLGSIVRILSSALEMLVQRDGLTETLRLHGNSLHKRYIEALKNKRNQSMEKDLAKKIANFGNESLSD